MKRLSVINAIRILSGAGIVFSIYLMVMETMNTGFCPGLWGIPACYFVLIAFMLVLVSSFIKNTAAAGFIFYPGSAGGLAIAVWFSYNQIAGLKHCPSMMGMPLCFASFFIFVLIIILGIIAGKILKNDK